MKWVQSFFIIFLISIPFCISAQVSPKEKKDQMEYYSSIIRDYLSYLKEWADQPSEVRLADQVDSIMSILDIEISKIEVPASIDEFNEAEEDTSHFEIFEPQTESGQAEEESTISKLIPFKNKTKTKLRIGVGINGLIGTHEATTVSQVPEVHTGGSWFWELGLLRSVPLAAGLNKPSFNFGLHYLVNRFSFENDVIVSLDQNGAGVFVPIKDVAERSKLRVGYLTIPLTFAIPMSKKFNLEVGGYGGYRLFTKQKLVYKQNAEVIHEYRYGRNAMNNWLYGVSFGLKFYGFEINGKYHLSQLFTDKSADNFNIFMIGTAIKLP
ncbi:MAG: hypothetical protein J5I52_06540 [Saprospiraceae bacterium]|nr:MAG: hypothetical protein UZ09_BCD002001779 [Bacteroidetes bacterium OLB9]MCO6463793.1 hypothetical protein [Saprospiraceae bacterium]MCZ2338829.1 outer membrane beta-barrel protein [Chitinophagales bacterium]